MFSGISPRSSRSSDNAWNDCIQRTLDCIQRKRTSTNTHTQHNEPSPSFSVLSLFTHLGSLSSHEAAQAGSEAFVRDRVVFLHLFLRLVLPQRLPPRGARGHSWQVVGCSSGVQWTFSQSDCIQHKRTHTRTHSTQWTFSEFLCFLTKISAATGFPLSPVGLYSTSHHHHFRISAEALRARPLDPLSRASC